MAVIPLPTPGQDPAEPRIVTIVRKQIASLSEEKRESAMAELAVSLAFGVANAQKGLGAMAPVAKELRETLNQLGAPDNPDDRDPLDEIRASAGQDGDSGTPSE